MASFTRLLPEAWFGSVYFLHHNTILHERALNCIPGLSHTLTYQVLRRKRPVCKKGPDNRKEAGTRIVRRGAVAGQVLSEHHTAFMPFGHLMCISYWRDRIGSVPYE